MKNFNIPTLEAIGQELLPILELLKRIESKTTIKPQQQEYYRNKDLKEKFGLSSNTIIKYRENNTIPFTQLGDIFYYPVEAINKILSENASY